MLKKEERLRLKKLLAEAIPLLCKNSLGLQVSSKFCVEAMIGITVDENQVAFICFKEAMSADGSHTSSHIYGEDVEYAAGGEGRGEGGDVEEEDDDCQFVDDPPPTSHNDYASQANKRIKVEQGGSSSERGVASGMNAGVKNECVDEGEYHLTSYNAKKRPYTRDNTTQQRFAVKHEEEEEEQFEGDGEEYDDGEMGQHDDEAGDLEYEEGYQVDFDNQQYQADYEDAAPAYDTPKPPKRGGGGGGAQRGMRGSGKSPGRPAGTLRKQSVVSLPSTSKFNTSDRQVRIL